MILSILGTDYEYAETTDKAEPNLKDCDGYCDHHDKKIFVETDVFRDDEKATDSAKDVRRKFIRRHELIHAFWGECGLFSSSLNEEWAVNALAAQFPKMLEAFRKVDAL